MFTFVVCLHPFIMLLKKMLSGLLNRKMVHLLVVGKLELSLPLIVLPMNNVDPRKIKVSMELNFTQFFLFQWLPPCF